MTSRRSLPNLKMTRLVQTRLDHVTIVAANCRPGNSDLTPDLRPEIESLSDASSP